MNTVSDDEEIIYTDNMDVACDGGNGPLGHPNVYLTITKAGQVVCPYCSRTFILEGGPADNRGNG